MKDHLHDSLETTTKKDNTTETDRSEEDETKTSPIVPTSRKKSNENIAREEMRSISEAYMAIWRTGLALLPSLLVAIGFLRREIYNQLANDEIIVKGALLPSINYYLGTALLCIVAHIFFKLSVILGDRWWWYRDKVIAEAEIFEDRIGDFPLHSSSKIWFRWVFFVFPAFDILIRFVLEVDYFYRVGGNMIDLLVPPLIGALIFMLYLLNYFKNRERCRSDPYKNFKLRVKWDGRYVAGISKISALKRTTEVVGHRDGGDVFTDHRSPGRTKFEAITLERGVIHDTEFEKWANKVWNYGSGLGAEVSLNAFRKDLIIEVYNEAGQLARSYKVFRCWVSEYQALPDLNANSNAVAIQHIKLKLENEGWERDYDVTDPSEPSFTGPA